ALGVRPKLYDKKSYRDIVIASRYQEQFLRTALTIVRPMGIVVYSTCTVTIEENEELIERLADSNPCIEIVDTGIKRGSRGVYGKYRDLHTRFHPHIHDTTGYFIAKLRRKC
ncbi:MAG TPA: 16S rRNA methyltransferase, partial [Ignisphaera sp.]|nr:16S rRNA methyltransferase [Ignisphaera sp.]